MISSLVATDSLWTAGAALLLLFGLAGYGLWCVARWSPVGAGALLVLVCLLVSQAAFAHEPYSKWLSPHGWKCCSELERECRPVRSRWDEQLGKFEVWHLGAWRPVEPSAVLHDKESPDGRSHACIRKGTVIVDCFVNGKPKS